jgi:hypothetical protein
MIHGAGKYKATSGEEFEGIYQEEKKEGYGVLKLSDGTIYKGMFKDD